MGNWTLTVKDKIPFPGGIKVIHGSAVGSSSYDSGGDGFNLDAYYSDNHVPTVICPQDDGYQAIFSGTSPDGKVKVYDGYGSEVSASTNLSDCVINFVAFGNAR